MNKDGQHRIKLYFQDYVKWYPEEWRWELGNDKESRDLYMKFRARKSSMHRDNDKGPYFDSIEKDADQFDMDRVEFTDFFGIRWKGEKGVHHYAGDADYEQHMYYYDPDEDDDELPPCVSTEVTADKVPDGYAEIFHNGVKEFIDAEDIVDVEYRYIVENHLFKDSHVVISYGDPIPAKDLWDTGKTTNLNVWDIHGVAKLLKKFKPELYNKFIAQVDEHFKKLQESDRDEEREFAPVDENGKFISAAEYFDRYLKSAD